MKLLLSSFAMFCLFSISALADDAAGSKPHGACAKIADACKSAGFIKGDWKKGDGLWRDCVDPIMQGVTSVPGAQKPLPAVDPAVVAECKAHRPKFGEGKVGSAPAPTTPPPAH